MEKSALVYIILTAVTVAFGFLVKNRDYTTEYPVSYTHLTLPTICSV